MVSGGRRDGAGRSASHLHTLPTKAHSFHAYRVLFGLEKPEFREGEYAARNPVVFLTVASIFFLVTRLLMRKDDGAAVIWAELVLHLGGSDAKKDAYARDILQLGQARNGSKKLSVTS